MLIDRIVAAEHGHHLLVDFVHRYATHCGENAAQRGLVCFWQSGEQNALVDHGCTDGQHAHLTADLRADGHARVRILCQCGQFAESKGKVDVGHLRQTGLDLGSLGIKDLLAVRVIQVGMLGEGVQQGL